MPITTSSYLDAIDRQSTLTDCLSSIVDLIALHKDLEFVDRDNFSLLLGFLDRELLEDNSWYALNHTESDRQDLFLSCYRAVSDLTNADGKMLTIDRDHLFFILHFLHQELIQVNTILDCLNDASNQKIDKPEVSLPFVKPEPVYKQQYSTAIGE